MSFKDKRIKIITHEKNLGISKALNTGIEHSSGKYIARMDGDDVSAVDRLEKQYCFMENNKDISICGCNMYIIKENVYTDHKTKYCLQDSEIKTDMFFGKTPFAHPTILCRSSFIKGFCVRYNIEAIYAEDLEMYCRCCNIAKYANLDETLHYYRIHNSSVSVQHKIQQLNIARKVINRFLKSEGLMLSEDEFNIHCSLYLPQDKSLSIKENAMITWREKMKSFIKSAQKYDKVRFKYLMELLCEKLERLRNECINHYNFL